MDEKLRLYIEKECTGYISADDDTVLIVGKQKLQDVLNEYMELRGAAEAERFAQEIRDFIAENETNEKLLYRFCYHTENLLGSNLIPLSYSWYHEKDKETSPLKELIEKNRNKLSFEDTVIEIMKAHDLGAPDVYNKVMLDRQVFHNALNPKRVERPEKITVWRIIIGLKCDLSEADRVLNSVGYCRDRSILDTVIGYYIKQNDKNEVLDITDIDDCLCDMYNLYKPKKTPYLSTYRERSK